MTADLDRQRQDAALNRRKRGNAMNKLKELWQYAVFRFIVLAPAIWFGLFIVHGIRFSDDGKIQGYNDDFLAGWSWWIAPLLVILWVWRKPIWKAIGFLNKKAE